MSDLEAEEEEVEVRAEMQIVKKNTSEQSGVIRHRADVLASAASPCS